MTERLQTTSFIRTKLQTIASEIIRDEVVDKWFLMDNIYPVLALVIAYLVFVLKVGPKFMENRKPLNIKGIILAYNFFQMINNGWIVYLLFTTPGAISHLAQNKCAPMEKSNPLFYAMCAGSWYFFMSKVYDLLDTVFFVLRKKQSHVTFLHVYHHANMVLSCWAYLKYIKGEQGVLIGVLNSFVHVVMYTYYFLSALGPQVQKYLWWKKYITKLQLLQFGIVCMYALFFVVRNCVQSQVLIYYAMFQAITFSILFADFYRKAYLKKKQ
nr:PREDICTED: elongation of very long chain fatty acids protein AAEL008004-like [Bemisia tabaci]